MMDRVVDWGERLVLLICFALFFVANVRSHDWINYMLIAAEGLTAYFVLTRRSAISVSTIPMDWALALGGTMLPLIVRPGGEPLAPWPLVVVMLTGGSCISVAAKLSLNRRFGIAPANRGVQRGFAYAFVRHPMYLGYIITQAGYLLHNPTMTNLMIYMVAWMMQFLRMSREERHLLQDPEYQDYASRVRYRVIPGVY